MSLYRIEQDCLLDEQFDVIVAGGGPAGCCAAVAASRDGAKTLLLEATSTLGGMATMGFVPAWCGFHDKEKFIHRGVAETIRHRLDGPRTDKPLDSVESLQSIDAELLKRILDDLMAEHGVTVLFHAAVTGVQMKDERTVDALLVSTKAGLQAYRAPCYVDCTGDADLAAWAGAETLYGDETGDVQPATLCFSMINPDQDKIHEELPEGFRQIIIDDPEFDLIKDDFFNPNARGLNRGHLWDVNNTDPVSLTKALMDGRREAWQMLAAFRKYAPTVYARARIDCTAPLLGVRETRRIVGDYTLTGEDHQARRRFDDEISLNSFFIDIHPSLKNRERERRGEWSWQKEKDDSRFAPGEFHGIPYRCLTPKRLDNVIVAGRSVSADREALSAIRVMPPCMTMGEAAGAAAADVANGKAHDVHAVDIQALRKRLQGYGAFLPQIPVAAE